MAYSRCGCPVKNFETDGYKVTCKKHNISWPVFEGKLQQLKECENRLRFYADKENHIPPIYEETGRPGAWFSSNIHKDKGHQAQQYFKKYYDDSNNSISCPDCQQGSDNCKC